MATSVRPFMPRPRKSKRDQHEISNAHYSSVFRSLLEHIIKKRGLRQSDVAARIGKTQENVSQMVRGHVMPNLKEIDVLATALRLDGADRAEFVLFANLAHMTEVAAAEYREKESLAKATSLGEIERLRAENADRRLDISKAQAEIAQLQAQLKELGGGLQ